MDTAMIALAALIGVGIALTFVARRSQRPALAVRAVVSGLLGINGLGLLVCAVMFGVLLGAPLPALAQEGIAPEGASSGVALGAALRLVHIRDLQMRRGGRGLRRGRGTALK